MTDVSMPALRPLRLAEILDQAIRLYRRNFVQFIGIVAIPYIPLIIIQAISGALSASSLQGLTGSSNPEAILTSSRYWLGITGSFLSAILQLFLIQGLATAALTRAIADTYVGQPVGIFSSYSRLGDSGMRLIGALLWAGLVSIGLVIWLIIPCAGWFSGPGIFVFLIWVVVPLVAPIVVLEKHGAIASVRRAWDLARTRFWWLIGFAVILYLFATIVVSGPTALISMAVRTLAVSGSQALDQQMVLVTVIQTLTTMITGLLYLPLQLSAITVVYFDLRVRSEGLDLALQAAPTAVATPAVESAASEMVVLVPAGPQSRLITGTDIGNFVLLTIGFIAVYALVVGVIMGLGMAMIPLLTPR